jgi:hypothetical protein
MKRASGNAVTASTTCCDVAVDGVERCVGRGLEEQADVALVLDGRELAPRQRIQRPRAAMIRSDATTTAQRISSAKSSMRA